MPGTLALFISFLMLKPLINFSVYLIHHEMVTPRVADFQVSISCPRGSAWLLSGCCCSNFALLIEEMRLETLPGVLLAFTILTVYREAHIFSLFLSFLSFLNHLTRPGVSFIVCEFAEI